MEVIATGKNTMESWEILGEDGRRRRRCQCPTVRRCRSATSIAANAPEDGPACSCNFSCMTVMPPPPGSRDRRPIQSFACVPACRKIRARLLPRLNSVIVIVTPPGSDPSCPCALSQLLHACPTNKHVVFH
jgi:hypothetical protein